MMPLFRIIPGAALLLAVFVALYPVCAAAQGAWQDSVPGNELPMYGERPKTEDQRAADAKFIATVLESGRSRDQLSDDFVNLGWAYYRRGDLATAMKRFNQAWLLDPENGDAFHGFAAVVGARFRDHGWALRLFEMALAKPRYRPQIHLDYGRELMENNRPADALPHLQKALGMPGVPADAMALYALALQQTGDIAGACVAAAKVQDSAQRNIRDRARTILRDERCESAR